MFSHVQTKKWSLLTEHIDLFFYGQFEKCTACMIWNETSLLLYMKKTVYLKHIHVIQGCKEPIGVPMSPTWCFQHDVMWNKTSLLFYMKKTVHLKHIHVIQGCKEPIGVPMSPTFMYWGEGWMNLFVWNDWYPHSHAYMKHLLWCHGLLYYNTCV